MELRPVDALIVAFSGSVAAVQVGVVARIEPPAPLVTFSAEPAPAVIVAIERRESRIVVRSQAVAGCSSVVADIESEGVLKCTYA